MSVFDADWRRTHVWQHMVGGAIWIGVLCLPPLRLTVPERLIWVTVIQGVWERYQREYDPTYPVWSMVGDTVLASTTAAIVLFSLSRVL